MNNNHAEFLYSVSRYIEKNPDVAAHVSDCVQEGLNKALKQSLERAADMEVVVAVLAERKYKGRDNLILNKLTKWKDKSSLKWDSLIEFLESKANTDKGDV